MFRVNPETVERLFNAQKPELRGQLRLDISSRCYPADPRQPLDMHCAPEALGERVVRVLKNCAADAALLGGVSTGFEEGVVPPPPDSDQRLRIMPAADAFERFVVYRLNRSLGLDETSEGYDTALRSLASDFFAWAHQPEAHDPFGFATENQGQGAAFISCRRPPRPAFRPLKRDGGASSGQGGTCVDVSDYSPGEVESAESVAQEGESPPTEPGGKARRSPKHPAQPPHPGPKHKRPGKGRRS